MADKANYIRDLFGRIAKRYDLLNDLMTLSLHRNWKEQTIKSCPINKGAIVLDLCTGTGDMAFMWAAKPEVLAVVALDSSPAMLAEARRRQTLLAKRKPKIASKIKFIEGDALLTPFEPNSFDATTIGFGLRNVANLEQAIKELLRINKAGAHVASLDLGHPKTGVVSGLYRNIFLKFIPSLGAGFARDKDAYQYLVDSLKTWPNQKALTDLFWKHGFSGAYYKDLMLGTIAIVNARK